MPNDPIQTLSIQFTDCQYGWIHFTISVGAQSVNIRASEVFDPFPSLIRWLKAILTGVDECRSEFNEEGNIKTFIAHRRWDETLWFRISDSAPESHLLLEAVVNRHQLIEALYRGIQKFALSDGYKRDHWDFISVSDKLKTLAPNLTLDAIIQSLAKLNQQELIAQFNEADQRYVEIRGTDSIADWPVPAEYNSWPAEQREEFLWQSANEHINSWDGTNLRELKSRTIESYLTHPELDDA